MNRVLKTLGSTKPVNSFKQDESKLKYFILTSHILVHPEQSSFQKFFFWKKL